MSSKHVTFAEGTKPAARSPPAREIFLLDDTEEEDDDLRPQPEDWSPPEEDQTFIERDEDDDEPTAQVGQQLRVLVHALLEWTWVLLLWLYGWALAPGMLAYRIASRIFELRRHHIGQALDDLDVKLEEARVWMVDKFFMLLYLGLKGSVDGVVALSRRPRRTLGDWRESCGEWWLWWCYNSWYAQLPRVSVVWNQFCDWVDMLAASAWDEATSVVRRWGRAVGLWTLVVLVTIWVLDTMIAAPVPYREEVTLLRLPKGVRPFLPDYHKHMATANASWSSAPTRPGTTRTWGTEGFSWHFDPTEPTPTPTSPDVSAQPAPTHTSAPCECGSEAHHAEHLAPTTSTAGPETMVSPSPGPTQDDTPATSSGTWEEVVDEPSQPPDETRANADLAWAGWTVVVPQTGPPSISSFSRAGPRGDGALATIGTLATEAVSVDLDGPGSGGVERAMAHGPVQSGWGYCHRCGQSHDAPWL